MKKSISMHLPVPPDMLSVRFHTKFCLRRSGTHPWIPGKMKWTFSICRQHWNNDKVINFTIVIKMQNYILDISLYPTIRYLLSPFPWTTDEWSHIDGSVRYDGKIIILAYCIPLCQVTCSSQTAAREYSNTPYLAVSPLLWSTHVGHHHSVSVKEALPWIIIWRQSPIGLQPMESTTYQQCSWDQDTPGGTPVPHTSWSIFVYLIGHHVFPWDVCCTNKKRWVLCSPALLSTQPVGLVVQLKAQCVEIQVVATNWVATPDHPLFFLTTAF